MTDLYMNITKIYKYKFYMANVKWQQREVYGRNEDGRTLVGGPKVCFGCAINNKLIHVVTNVVTLVSFPWSYSLFKQLYFFLEHELRTGLQVTHIQTVAIHIMF